MDSSEARSRDSGAHPPDGRHLIASASRPVVLGIVASLLVTGCFDPFDRGLVAEGADIGQGRVERPEAGYAIELPARWRAREVNPDERLNRFGLRLARFDLGGRLDAWLRPPSSRYSCYVHVNDTGDRHAASAERYARWTTVRLRSDVPGVRRVRRSSVSLPAGEGQHLRIVYRRSGSGSEYILSDAGVTYAIGCFAPDYSGFERRWRALADRFELING